MPWIFRLVCDTCGGTSSAYASAKHGPLARDAETRAWQAFLAFAERDSCPECCGARRVWRDGRVAPLEAHPGEP